MYRKSLITSLFIITVLFAANIGVSAQTFISHGKVEMRQADGTTVPVEGALIDVFRTDISSKGVTAKTNKKGEYNIVGLAFGGVFLFAASAPGASPQIIPDIRGSVEKEYNFVLSAGDGKRLALEEVLQLKSAGNFGTSGGEAKLSPEQKKAQEEFEKKKKEVEDKNSRVQNADKTIATAQKEGVDALKAKNYDLALAKFDEGIQADPDYVQSVTMFRNFRSEALRGRGFEKHVSWVTTKDASLRAASKTDLQAAYDEAKSNLENIQKVPVSTDPKEADFMAKNKYNALANMSSALYLMAVNEIDMSKAEEIKSIYPQFLAVETDPAKNEIKQHEFADALRKSSDCDDAIIEYKKILDTKPDEPDALAGTGLCLVNNGFTTDNKATLQEGLNVLQHFVDVAPDTHKMKADAKNTIEYLKTEQKLVPQKTTAPKAVPKKKP